MIINGSAQLLPGPQSQIRGGANRAGQAAQNVSPDPDSNRRNNRAGDQVFDAGNLVERINLNRFRTNATGFSEQQALTDYQVTSLLNEAPSSQSLGLDVFV